MSDDFSNDLFCLVLPLTNTNILVPSLIVAEVLSNAQLPVNQSNSANDWFLGFVNWRKQDIPVFSYELANGDVNDMEHAQRFNRIAVFKSLSQFKELDYYALIINDIPRVRKFRSGDLVNLNQDAGVLSITAVEARGDVALIPNIDYLESCIIRRLKQ